jgi:hypothetical protein
VQRLAERDAEGKDGKCRGEDEKRAATADATAARWAPRPPILDRHGR